MFIRLQPDITFAARVFQSDERQPGLSSSRICYKSEV